MNSPYSGSVCHPILCQNINLEINIDAPLTMLASPTVSVDGLFIFFYPPMPMPLSTEYASFRVDFLDCPSKGAGKLKCRQPAFFLVKTLHRATKTRPLDDSQTLTHATGSTKKQHGPAKENPACHSLVVNFNRNLARRPSLTRPST